jgi:hypothetical protein
MLRSSASPRRVLGLGLAVAVGTGIGLGAYSLGSAFGSDTPQFPRVGSAATATAPARPGAPDAPATTTAPSPSEASASAPLTLEEATALAAQVAPGRVVEWDEDHEPTGLRYDVTLLHDDGSTTDVEVDTVTGQVTSINHDNDWD